MYQSFIPGVVYTQYVGWQYANEKQYSIEVVRGSGESETYEYQSSLLRCSSMCLILCFISRIKSVIINTYGVFTGVLRSYLPAIYNDTAQCRKATLSSQLIYLTLQRTLLCPQGPLHFGILKFSLPFLVLNGRVKGVRELLHL